MRVMFTKAIVRPPSANFCEGLTTAALGTPDYQRALEQHASYCAALLECGLELIRLEADERYPDSCFVEDVALIIGAENSADENVRADSSKSAIITRPGADSRRGEIASMRAQLTQRFQSIYEIKTPGTLDGGDVCDAGTHFFIGISERTNEAAAEQLAGILATRGWTSTFVDIRAGTHAQDARATSLLHLKSGVAHLGGNNLIVTEALAPREEFRGFDLIEVDTQEEYAANCIEVNGRVLMAAGHPRLAAKLNELGYNTMALEMSEFQKMDGGLSCLSLRW
jgi:dimethylargininase